MVNGALGWALTGAGLFVTRDAGHAWSRWPLEAPDQVSDIAMLSSSHAMVAAGIAGALTVRESNDGGRVWRNSRISPMAGVAAARFAYANGRVAGLLVTRASGSNFSAGDWYVPQRAGSWRRWAAPAGGAASVAGGVLWLAGGPGNDRLYRSTDGGATWSRASLPRLGDGAVAGLGAPFALGNQVVLPVTVANGSRTAVEFLMSRDRGASWARLASVALAGEVGAGVTVPTAVCPSGVLVAVAPNGSQVVRARATGGKPQVVSARGLPSAVTALSMIDAKIGWAPASPR